MVMVLDIVPFRAKRWRCHNMDEYTDDHESVD